MTTPDAGSGGPSGLEDSLPGPPQAAEPELDAYGLPVQNRRPGRTYRLELAVPICALGSMCLAIMDMAANGKLALCLIALGILSSLLATALLLIITVRNAGKDQQIAEVSSWIVVAGSLLGFIAFLCLMGATWPQSMAGGGG